MQGFIAIKSLLSALVAGDRRFVAPPSSAFAEAEQITPERFSYAKFNYLNDGALTRLKRLHFDQALDMADRLLPSDSARCVSALDVGCADGIFLPTLSQHFETVVGIDIRSDMIHLANCVVNEATLTNVRLLCSSGMSSNQVRGSLGSQAFSVAFSLETIEHVGDPADIYPSKVEFLKEISSWLSPGSLIIISVPNMVGVPFLLQRAVLAGFNMPREPLSWKNLALAGFFKNTDGLEKDWAGGHVGFNHLKLEKMMDQSFEIVERIDLFFQVIYALKTRQ